MNPIVQFANYQRMVETPRDQPENFVPYPLFDAPTIVEYETTPSQRSRRWLLIRGAAATAAMVGGGFLGGYLWEGGRNRDKSDPAVVPSATEAASCTDREYQTIPNEALYAIGEIVNQDVAEAGEVQSLYALELNEARKSYGIGADERFSHINLIEYRREGSWDLDTAMFELLTENGVRMPLEVEVRGGYDEGGYITHFSVPNIQNTDQERVNIGFYMTYSDSTNGTSVYSININEESFEIRGPCSNLAKPKYGTFPHRLSRDLEDGSTSFYTIYNQSQAGQYEEQMTSKKIEQFARRENSYRALMFFITDTLPSSQLNPSEEQ